MIITTETYDEKATRLIIDFSDEGVDLCGDILVAGDEQAALGYAPFFEADLRRNYAELFPVPEMPEMGGEMI